MTKEEIEKPELSPDAYRLLKERYCQRGEEPQDVYKRVAKAVAKATSDPEYYEQKFLWMMNKRYFLPNSPCIRNAGRSNMNKACISKDTLILTKRGLVRMEDVKVGDYVLTHKGRWKRVINKIYKGKRKTIKIAMAGPRRKKHFSAEVTPDHLIYGADDKWHRADTIAHPHNLVPPKAKPPEKIGLLPNDKDTAWLLGFYIAEGDIYLNNEKRVKNPKRVVRFTNSDRRKLERVKSIVEKYISSRASINSYRTWYTYRIYSDEIGKALEDEFGRGHAGKRLPDWIYAMDRDWRAAFLEGVLEGDGLKRYSSSWRIVLRNPTLTFQLKMLAESLGYYTTFIPDIRQKGQTGPTSLLTINKRQKPRYKIVGEGYNDVYDISVEDDHSFIAGEFVVHNCFVLPIEDSMESIFKTLHNSALIFKHGGGVGYNFSNLREKGAPLSGGGTSSGVMSFMRIYNAITDAIKQGGFRRGASMGILDYDHPEIVDFVREKITLHSMNNFNLSVLVDDDFMKAATEDDEYVYLRSRLDRRHIVGKIKARDLFAIICYSAWMCGDPGMLFFDRINKDNPFYPKLVINATNPCVTGDTLVLTDKGLIPAAELKGDEKLWTLNGWTDIKRVLNNGIQDVYLVRLKNGQEIKITSDHKLLTRTGWKALKELNVGDEIRIVLEEVDDFKRGKEEINKELAEFLGFWTGDGSLSVYDHVSIHPGKDEELAKYIWHIANKITGHTHLFTRDGQYIIDCHRSDIARLLRKLFNINGRSESSKKRVPSAIFTQKKEIIAAYLRALFSADGSVYDGNGTVTISLSSTSRELLKDVQLLLSIFGIYSRITKEKPAEEKLIKNRTYKTKPTYRLLISSKYALSFRNKIGLLGSKGEKLNKLLENKKFYNKDHSFEEIVSIEYVGKEVVYDVTAPPTYTWVTNGIYSYDCGEQPLYPYDSCCLGSINLSKLVENGEFNMDLFKELIELGTRFLLAVNKITEFPIQECYIAQARYNRIGLGVMGFADALMKLHIYYDSDEALKFIDKIAPVMRSISRKIAVQSVSTLSIAPTGSLSILASCSPSIEPIFARSYIRQLSTMTVKEEREASEYLRTAHEVSPEWHLKIQARWQKYVDSGVSKTINLPYEATIRDVMDIYVKAWKMGCKGITIFRDKCRGDTGQVFIRTEESRRPKCDGDVCYL